VILPVSLAKLHLVIDIQASSFIIAKMTGVFETYVSLGPATDLISRGSKHIPRVDP
jgi:hypothetical protein